MVKQEAIHALSHLGEHDPVLLREAVDTTPTLEQWASIGPILNDMDFSLGLMAAAYDAGVFSIERLHRRINDSQDAPMDLPIGAAVGDPHTGMIAQGFARDKELDDPTKHAERVTFDNMQDLGMKIGGLTMCVTVEPCPGCLEEIDEFRIDGVQVIKRVMYGATRREVERLGLVKPHADTAPDLVRAGRSSSSKYSFEFFQMPNRAVQAASLELLVPFLRNIDSGQVGFDPGAMRATRFGRYSHAMKDSRYPSPPAVVYRREPTERQAMISNFADVLSGFYR